MGIKEKFKNPEVPTQATGGDIKERLQISRCFIKHISVRDGLNMFDCSSVHRHGLNDLRVFFLSLHFYDSPSQGMAFIGVSADPSRSSLVARLTLRQCL